MIDSLALAIALLSAPVARPNMSIATRIQAPKASQMIVVNAPTLARAESLTTCYENSVGSCWSNK